MHTLIGGTMREHWTVYLHTKKDGRMPKLKLPCAGECKKISSECIDVAIEPKYIANLIPVMKLMDVDVVVLGKSLRRMGLKHIKKVVPKEKGIKPSGVDIICKKTGKFIGYEL